MMAPVTPPRSPHGTPRSPRPTPRGPPTPRGAIATPPTPPSTSRIRRARRTRPRTFFCPVSLELMRDPVTIPSTGQTFERRAIESWLSRGGRLCPTTDSPWTPAETFVPNDALRAAVLAWALEECPAVVDPETAAIRESPEARDARLALERADANAAAKRAHTSRPIEAPRFFDPDRRGKPDVPGTFARRRRWRRRRRRARLHPREPRGDSDIDERTRRALGSSAAVRSSVDVHRVRRRRVRVQRGARQPSHLSASRRKSPSRRFQTEHDRHATPIRTTVVRPTRTAALHGASIAAAATRWCSPPPSRTEASSTC